MFLARQLSGATPWYARAWFIAVTSSIYLLGACSTEPSSNEPEVTQALIMQPLPGKTLTSGYFELQNNTDQALVLMGASSSHARAIEIHRSSQVDGKMRMQRVPQVEIASGARATFAPGGLHLMLFGVEDPPETIDVRLTFAQHPPIDATFDRAHW